jgi:TonB-dependent starch-binding outer membrane protein SusC
MKKTILLLLFSVVFAASAFAQRTVTGTVTEAGTGEPLAGVTVVVQGTTVGASTNIDGEYSIRVPQGRNILEFSFVGFRTAVETIGDRTTINVELSEDLQLLDEVVVTGYGTLSRRQLTSSIGQVSSRDIEDVSLTTAESAIQGRVSGVQFTTNSGVLGSATTIRIRGASSISASTTPLVVIDGVPVTNPTTSGSSSVGSGLGATTGLNPLLNLNPNDIESMEVLKDAAASAIYGSRGSNGVILITTKRGRADRQEVNIRTYAGIVNETNRYEMMDGFQFTDIWNSAGVNFFAQNGFDALLNDAFGTNESAEYWWFNGSEFILGAQASLDPNNIQSANWMDEVTQTGYMQETSASVSGGSERTTYYLSGTYRWEEGYIRNNELNRYSARLRLDHNLSETVRVGLSLNPSRTDNFRVYTSNAVAAPYTFSALYYPNVPVRNDDGSLNLDIDPNAFVAFFGSPVGNLEGDNVVTNITQFLGSSYMRWNISENLAFNSDFSFDLFQVAEQIRNGALTTNGFPNGFGFSSNSQYRNFNFTNTFEYRNNFGDHDINAIAGITLQESQNVSFSASGQAFPSDRLRNLSSAADITGATGSGSSFSFVGYLSRINYTFRDRYILTLTGRVDGSSRFSDENQYGFFPAVSAGWIVSDEDFMDPVRNTLDFLKLRASVGQTGNAEIGNFPTLGLVGYGADYNGIPGGRVTQLANPDLRWEKTTQYDGAVEFGLFSSRLRGSIGFYRKDTADLLLNVPISRVNGFTSFTDNIGEVRNQGLEIDLSADIFQGTFNWTTSLNFSTLQNEVLTLVDGQDQIFGNNKLSEGEPLGQFFLVRYAGVNSENGNAQWLTADGEVTEAYSTAHRVVVGNPFPEFFGGFTNNMAYRGIDLTVFFQYSWGNDIYRADGGFTDTNLNSLFNQSVRQTDYWSPDNPNAANPEPRLLTANGSQASTRYLEDASYIRLKQATLGYTLPVELTRDVRARIYVQGQNLFTITRSDFFGSDPEAASGGNIQSTDVFFQLPQARTIMAGVNLTF